MNDQIASILRTVLKVVGAGLVTKGYIDAAGLEGAVGAVITLVGVIWSAVEHKKTT